MKGLSFSLTFIVIDKKLLESLHIGSLWVTVTVRVLAVVGTELPSDKLSKFIGVLENDNKSPEFEHNEQLGL